MATIKGKGGVLNVGANAVGSLQSWSFTTTTDTAETHSMGDNWKTREAFFNDWSGQAECFLDPADTTGQGAMSEGAEIALTFRPDGTGAGKVEYTGNCIVTSAERNGTKDGMVMWTVQVQGDGAITEATQV